MITKSKTKTIDFKRIDLDKEILEFLLKIIRVYYPKAKITIFGSRVRGRATEFSDIDVALEDSKKIEFIDRVELEEVFNASWIPFIVDIVDLNSVSPEFRKVVKETGVEVS